MKSEVYLRERLRGILIFLLPKLDAEGQWPHSYGYGVEQGKHWFYCLTEVLELERREHERLDRWMYRLAQELGPPAKV